MQERNTQAQQLGRSITPTDAAQVRSNCGQSLKVPRGKDGVADVKTFPNSPDEQERSGKSGQDVRVPVINMRGEPLMPTRPRKARKLLEQGRARVVGYNPFTIQLLYGTGEEKEEIVLGAKKLTFVERARGKIAEVRRAIPHRAEARGLLAHD